MEDGMADKEWIKIKTHYCDHVNEAVDLQAEAVFPAEILPDQPPRLGAHRCEQGYLCSLSDQAACVWAGTNPAFDPFIENLNKKKPKAQ